MGLFNRASKSLGRAQYAAKQGVRAAWYGTQMATARRRSGGFNRPGEAPFRPDKGAPDMAVLRRAYLQLFVQDRLNVEAGLYPPPQDARIRDFPKALRSAAAFQRDSEAVDERRLARNGTEVREALPEESNRYPAYYRQNFHYQSDGWFSDESAKIYDTQVEALFTGTANAMRRTTLAEISKTLKGRDQRGVRLLDLACGNGSFLTQVMEVFPRLRATGLDLSPNYTDAARERLKPWAHVDILHEAAEAMPLADESMDIVSCIYLFHELPPKVRPVVLAEVARVLKPGGVFLLADSVQFGDYPEIDGLLEYFPHGFHEPYYRGYLDWERDTAVVENGLSKQGETLAFLTKVSIYQK